MDIYLNQTYLGISFRYLSISFLPRTYLKTYLCTFQDILGQVFISHSQESFPHPAPRPPPPPLPYPAQWARPRFLNLNATAVQMQARCVIHINW